MHSNLSLSLLDSEFESEVLTDCSHFFFNSHSFNIDMNVLRFLQQGTYHVVGGEGRTLFS